PRCRRADVRDPGQRGCQHRDDLHLHDPDLVRRPRGRRRPRGARAPPVVRAGRRVTERVNVGVVGATGVVGSEMLTILAERDFPVADLRAYASPRSEGRRLSYDGREVVCEILRDGCFDGLDFAVIDVDDALALEWAPRAAAAGARVVDNSAAFRMEPDVPLV